MIRFREMTEDEFSEFKVFNIEGYAQDIARNYRVPIEEARSRSASQVEGLLSQGLATPNHVLYVILLEDEIGTTPIGDLWLDVNESKLRCFIYNIFLSENFRGKGLGRETLEVLDKTMKVRGIRSIGLHVFADNAIARDLYQKMGYQVTGINMQKWLDSDP